MGLSSITNRVSFSGDGSSTVFAFPYYFFNNADLSVYLFDTNSSIVTTQTLNTHYTISGNVNAQGVYPSGGNVVMNSSFPSSYQIVITRNPSQIQNFALLQNGPINSLGIVQQLDYLTTLVQRLQDEVSRAVQLPDGLGTSANGLFNMNLPASITLNSTAYAPLVVNSGANGWAFGVVATGASGAIGYAGLLPISNGGTGQGGGLTPKAVWYSNTGSSMIQTNVGNPGQVLMANSGSIPTFIQLDISNSSMVTGALTATAGGTGLSSFIPQYGVMYSSSSSQMAIVPSASAGMSLLSKGSSAPVFEQMNLSSSAQFTGILPILNGGTNASSAVQSLINLWPGPLTRGDILVVNSGTVVSRLAIGTDNFVLTANSSIANTTGVLWQNPSSTNQLVSTKTTNYQMTSNDDLILVSSSAFTLSLPDATTATKKPYKITKSENTILAVPSQIIIAASGAQQIGSYGGSVGVFTPNESWTVMPDGSNWQLLDHFSSCPDFNAGSSVITSSGAGVVVGTTVYNQFICYRSGAYNNWRWEFKALAGVAGTGDYRAQLPLNLVINTSLIFTNSSVFGATDPSQVGSSVLSVIGLGWLNNAATTFATISAFAVDSKNINFEIPGQHVWAAGNAGNIGGATLLSLSGRYPVAGWNA